MIIVYLQVPFKHWFFFMQIWSSRLFCFFHFLIYWFLDSYAFVHRDVLSIHFSMIRHLSPCTSTREWWLKQLPKLHESISQSLTLPIRVLQQPCRVTLRERTTSYPETCRVNTRLNKLPDCAPQYSHNTDMHRSISVSTN